MDRAVRLPVELMSSLHVLLGSTPRLCVAPRPLLALLNDRRPAVRRESAYAIDTLTGRPEASEERKGEVNDLDRKMML